ncbi:hypothetical protein [Acanthopleuribacter pedis]|uniref:Uncharacterized protein n=1 Tax=Acanthopleuribacter pedis TaxID=442870 RepID=A0A8J7QJQ5_9BACT|nr:hypothetical protein [Acanthopleuribacter pedis]MBO1322151.1 hypothetical protein [Acanthopleuribacter pedis]
MKILFSLLCLAAGCVSLSAAPQWIAHLSANDDFKSDILVRNDSFDETLSVTLNFFASDGGEAAVTLTDAAGQQNAVRRWEVTLAPQTAALVQLQSVTGGDNRSVQARVDALNQSNEETTLLAVEASFTRFEAGTAVSKVGVALSAPARIFKVNTPASEPRGFGITNTDPGQSCECTFTLVGNDGTQLGTTTASIPAHAKWLGVVDTLFPGYATTLNSELGSINALCSTPVVVQGLAFNGTVTSGIPTTGFNLSP